MKRLNILLLALILFGVKYSFGQALLVSPSDTFTSTTVLVNSSDSHSQYGTLTNNTRAGDSIYWRLVSANMDSAWSMFFCDPNNCYYFTMSELNYGPHHFFADSGNSVSVHFGATPSCVAATGELVLVTWVADDSAASAKTFSYTGTYTGSCATAIQNVAMPQVSVYPNPVSSALTIDGLYGLRNVKLTVYDMLGNIVCEKYVEQPSGATSINTASLQAGVYVIAIDNDGARLLTKRIQKMN